MASIGGRIDFTPDPGLFPFEARWLETSVGPVHYIDEGAGRPILFCHGNPTWSFLYRNIVLRLRDRFRCVAVDYPGFGLSIRPAGYGYTAEEHARVVVELVDHLGLDDLVVMGQDWGGPIGLGAASERADRIGGVVLGNTWFWPTDWRSARAFSVVMSSPPMQWAILHRNLFVGFVPRATTRKLTAAEMDHYRKVQPTPDARKGVAEFPRQLRGASAFLADLEGKVKTRLADKRALLTWGMKDVAFPPKDVLPRVRSTFTDHELVELPAAKHFIQEDAPDEIATAIAGRFG